MKVTHQSSWEIQKSVVFALFIRELKSRFGRFKLGYFWAVMDPVAGILVLCLIRVAMGSGDIYGLSFPVFFASGMLIYKMFGAIGTSTIGQVEQSMALLSYQRIKPMDALVAKGILETLIAGGTMAIVFGGLYWMGYTFVWNDTLKFLAIFGCMVALSFGVGCVFATISPFFQEFKKIAPIIIQPLFFISGVFFSLRGIPEGLHPLLTWNPLLHAVELGRAAMFEGYSAEGLSMNYLAGCSLVSLVLGVALFRRYRITLVTSGAVKLT